MTQTAKLGFDPSYRFGDDLLNRILAGCRTGDEWWARHPYLPVTVSNMGNVRGVRGFTLKPYLHDGRYPCVDICGRRHVRIHRLVLETFIGPRPDGLEACHWNGVKTDCRLSNLRWDDKVGNMADRQRHRRERQRVVRERLEQLAAG